MYWQVVFLGCVIAGAFYVYFNSNDEENVPQRNQEQEEKRKTHASRCKIELLKASKPGDKCFWCMNKMFQNDFHLLSCQHALHEKCFNEFKGLVKKCLICDSSDRCVICFNDENPLTEANATRLSCQEHALHTKCLFKYKENGFTVCPLCRKDI